MRSTKTTETETLLPIVDSEPCSCASCRTMCRRPCWPVPADVRALIKAGEGRKLMLDWWVGGFGETYDDVYIVCPATPGHEGAMAPDGDFMFLSLGSPLHSGCTFHEDGMCVLHERRLKPAEGRAAHHALEQPDLHENVARYWDTDEGRDVVAAWCKLVGIDNPYAEG